MKKFYIKSICRNGRINITSPDIGLEKYGDISGAILEDDFDKSMEIPRLKSKGLIVVLTEEERKALDIVSTPSSVIKSGQVEKVFVPAPKKQTIVDVVEGEAAEALKQQSEKAVEEAVKELEKAAEVIKEETKEEVKEVSVEEESKSRSLKEIQAQIIRDHAKRTGKSEDETEAMITVEENKSLKLMELQEKINAQFNKGKDEQGVVPGAEVGSGKVHFDIGGRKASQAAMKILQSAVHVRQHFAITTRDIGLLREVAMYDKTSLMRNSYIENLKRLENSDEASSTAMLSAAKEVVQESTKEE